MWCVPGNESKRAQGDNVTHLFLVLFCSVFETFEVVGWHRLANRCMGQTERLCVCEHNVKIHKQTCSGKKTHISKDFKDILKREHALREYFF